MMRSFHIGFIAGLLGGLFIFIYGLFKLVIGYPTFITEWHELDWFIEYLIYHFGIQGIFGGIYAIIYSKFYNGVPGNGAMKGVVFGLIIGLLVNVSYASYLVLIWLFTGFEFFLIASIGWFEGVLIWLVFGIVLGPLYEKWGKTA